LNRTRLLWVSSWPVNRKAGVIILYQSYWWVKD